MSFQLWDAQLGVIWGSEHPKVYSTPSLQFASSPTDEETQGAATGDISLLTPIGLQSPEKLLQVSKL